MRRKLLWILLTVGVLLAVVGYGYKNRYASSIGIIGGADGPTAIFVAGKTGLIMWLGAAIVLLAAFGLIAYMLGKK